VNRYQKILLRPTKSQELLFRGSAGLSRFSWNWGLAIWRRYYSRFGKPIGAMRLNKFWNKIKKRKPGLNWVSGYSKHIAQDTFRNLESAFLRAAKSAKSGGRLGFPRFHKKGQKDSFQVVPSKQFGLSIYGKKIHIPKIGRVRFQGELRWPEGTQTVGRVKLHAGRWYLFLAYDLPDLPKLTDDRPSCGIDLGCKTFATIVSNGQLVQSVEPPKPYAKAKRKLGRLQRIVSRRKKGSKRREKAKLKVARLHKHIADIRSNFLHQLTSRIVKSYGTIVIEDLSVSGMAKGMLSGTVHDLGFAEFRHQLEYKSEAAGSAIVLADRFFPSSKTCSSCGEIKPNLGMHERAWVCTCGTHHDRDVNAAINLENIGKIPRSAGKSTTAESRGSTGSSARVPTQRSSNTKRAKAQMR